LIEGLDRRREDCLVLVSPSIVTLQRVYRKAFLFETGHLARINSLAGVYTGHKWPA